MNEVDLLVGVAILVGLVGIVVPVLPGSILILVAVLVWTVAADSGTAWLVFALATTLLVVGAVVKYVVPGRGLRTAGIPNRTVMVGGLLGIVGFFVVPVVGLVIGFVLGVYLSEARRVGRNLAWPSTVAAMKAVGLSVFVELVAGLLAAGVWAVGALTF